MDGSCKCEDTVLKSLSMSLCQFYRWKIEAVTAVRMKYNNSSTIYSDECWAMNKNISAYMSSFYGKCINKSCSSIHSRVSAFLKNLERVDSSTVMHNCICNFVSFSYCIVGKHQGRICPIHTNGLKLH